MKIDVVKKDNKDKLNGKIRFNSPLGLVIDSLARLIPDHELKSHLMLEEEFPTLVESNKDFQVKKKLKFKH